MDHHLFPNVNAGSKYRQVQQSATKMNAKLILWFVSAFQPNLFFMWIFLCALIKWQLLPWALDVWKIGPQRNDYTSIILPLFFD